MLRTAVAVVLLAACTDPQGSGPSGTSHVEIIDLPGTLPTSFDVLFVIDDSAAIAPYVDRVVALAYQLEAAAKQARTGQLDLHVAAITTTGGGVLRSAPMIDGPVLIDVHAPNGTRTENFDGTLGDALARLIAAGTSGTAPSQPLEAARTALAAPSDLVRTFAYLAVVIVAAEDDASPDAPETYANALKALHDDPSNILVSGLYATPAPRLDQLVAAFPNRASVADLATGDLAQPFALYGVLEKTVLGHVCLAEPADVDPSTPGPQYDCALAIVREDGLETVLPPCNAGLDGACWRLEPDPSCLAASVTLALRGFDGMPQPHVRGTCVAD